jgi:hypothetical protein
MAARAPFDSEQCDGAVTRFFGISVFAPASSSGTASHFFARWRVEREIEDLGATVRYHSSDGSDPPTFELDEHFRVSAARMAARPDAAFGAKK